MKMSELIPIAATIAFEKQRARINQLETELKELQSDAVTARREGWDEGMRDAARLCLSISTKCTGKIEAWRVDVNPDLKSCRKLERELAETCKALDELHVAIECAPGDVIHDWYCTDPPASEARDNAIRILLKSNYRGGASAEPSNAGADAPAN